MLPLVYNWKIFPYRCQKSAFHVAPKIHCWCKIPVTSHWSSLLQTAVRVEAASGRELHASHPREQGCLQLLFARDLEVVLPVSA